MFISTRKYPLTTEEFDVDLGVFGDSNDLKFTSAKIDDVFDFFLTNIERTAAIWTGYSAGRLINAIDNIRNLPSRQLVAINSIVSVFSLEQEDSKDVPVRVASVLTANQEVTPSNNPNARGTSVLRLNSDGEALNYQLTVFGLDFGRFIGDGTPFTADTSDDVTKVHIHNAIRGENGPLAFAPIDLSDPAIDNQDADDLQILQNADGSVTLTGQWELTDPALISLSEFVDDFRSVENGGDIPLYWNIHTQGSPSGAIRGQLLERELQPPVRLSSALTTGQEVTPSNNSEASGQSILQLNSAGDALSYTLTVFGLDFGQFIGDGTAFTSDTSDDVTKVHIHNAVRGENGPLAFALIDLEDLAVNDQDNDDLTISRNEDGSVTLQGIWETSDPSLIPLSDFVNTIRGTAASVDVPLYWNVHTVGSPAGAIRGQWQPDDLRRVDLPNTLVASYSQATLSASGGYDRFIFGDDVIKDNLQQQFVVKGFDDLDELDLGSAMVMSTTVISHDRMTANLSSGDTLIMEGDITAAQNQMLTV